MPAHCRRAKYEKDCHVVYRQSLIFLHLSHFSQKNKAYLALEIDFVSDLKPRLGLILLVNIFKQLCCLGFEAFGIFDDLLKILKC